MDIELMLALLGATFGPLAGIATAWMLDRRTKRTADLETTVAAKEATTHQWEVLSSGFGEYTEMMERNADRLATRVTQLEQMVESLGEDLTAIMKHVETVEKLVPVDQLPERPAMSWRRAS